MIKKVVVLVILLFGCILINRMEANDSIASERKIPLLNNHAFVPMDIAYSPFTRTNLRMRLGLAQTERLKYLALTIGDYELLSLEGNILFSDMNFYYQQRIKDWLAMYANFDFTARVGSEFSTLFAEGVNTVNEFDLGWLLKMYQTEKQILSLHFNVSNIQATIIDFRNAFDNIVNDTLVAVSQKVPALLGNIGARYYYVPTELFGIGLLAEVAYGESFTRGKTTFFYKFGAKFDLDLYSKPGYLWVCH